MKKILFTGGGTGGHIYPNLALINLLKNDYNIIYVGSKNSMEEKLVSKKCKFYAITTVKLKRSLSLKNLAIPFKLIKGICEAKKIIKAEKPDLIFSKGGFVSVPVVLAGSKLKVPCLTHESDLTLGLANKLIKNKCKYVLTSFKQTSFSCKNGIFTGSPIRKEILKVNKEKSFIEYPKLNNKPNILIFGGSLGSKTINNVIFQNIDALLKHFNVYHIVGKNNKKQINKSNYYQFEFVLQIEKLFAISDLVITRGGSNALFELLSMHKPMIIIPLSKKESRGDQILNADYLKKEKLANVIYEENLSIDELIKCINQTLKNKQMFIENQEKYNGCGNDNIIKIIKDTIKKDAK